MKNDISPDLIRKYIDGSCTAEEAEAVQTWYALFEDEPAPLMDSELKIRMLNQVRANIGVVNVQHKKRRNKVLLYRWASAAAVLIVVLGLIFYRPGVISEQTGRKAATGKHSDQILVHNTTSSLHKHVLSDGSVVWLNPSSSISYSKKFSPDSRKVSLTGNAFFEVTKDKKRPFIIYGEEVITKVWGTSFSISYDAESKATEVAVLTGKVSVRPDKHNGQEVMLLPNQKAVYARIENKLSKKEIAEGSAISMWKKESVVFEHITLSQITKVLNTTFDVNIEVADTGLNAYVLKADFTGQSLPEILLILEKSLNIRYTIDGKNITLYKQQPQ
ncbi:FecR family protein [Pedobacter nyackensis]|uniref:FecR family protein n=1 Tax=Pedobacter nyackensis TaxID=475255 RepID=A0A1W2AAM3_9SPHI|nr:FecR domain-containing protein [Pedobacter nyackensis]SMC57694.1 FecR family protein [Pedobacter nyackensis]